MGWENPRNFHPGRVRIAPRGPIRGTPCREGEEPAHAKMDEPFKCCGLADLWATPNRSRAVSSFPDQRTNQPGSTVERMIVVAVPFCYIPFT